MTDFMHTLGYINAFAYLLFAAHLFSLRPANPLPSRLLGLNFLLFALQSFLLPPVLSDGLTGLPAIIRPTNALLMNPCLVAYFMAAANPQFRLKLVHLLHLLPAVICAIEVATRQFIIDIDTMIIASMAAYAVALANRTRRGKEQFLHLGENAAITYKLLVAASLLMFYILVVELIILWELSAGRGLPQSMGLTLAVIMNLAVVAFALIAAMQRPSPFDWMRQHGRTRQTRQRGPEQEAAPSVVEAFETYIKRHDWINEETPTLQSVAKDIGVSGRLLSEAINDTYRESFSRHMNRRRVNRATELLATTPDANITTIMYDAGFKTKSSFNKEFKAITGMSPTAYRAKIQSS